MQRLSLDSSASKVGYGGRKDEAHADSITSSVSSSSTAIDYDDHDVKESKPRRLSLQLLLSSSNSRLEKLIHVIPVLIVICFVVLYLSSHTPSQSDLSHFSRFKQLPKHLEDSAETKDDSRFVELRRADVFAIRSLRNLQEMERYSPSSRPHPRSHRKTAGF